MPILLLLKAWLEKNQDKIWQAAACLFFVLWVRGCGQLADCQKGLANSKTTATVLAEQKSKVEANCKGKVVVKPAASSVDAAGKTIFVPCPEVVVDFEGHGGSDTAQAASATATVAPPACPKGATGGLFLGGGYIDTPYVAVGIQVGPVSVQGQRSLLSWGGQATYRLITW